MKAIYEFYWDLGRSGSVGGIFIADKDVVNNAIGSGVNLGEAAGKHSEVYGTLDLEDLTMKTDDQTFIKSLEDVMGVNWGSGYNPLDYIEEDYDYDD